MVFQLGFSIPFGHHYKEPNVYLRATSSEDGEMRAAQSVVFVDRSAQRERTDRISRVLIERN